MRRIRSHHTALEPFETDLDRWIGVEKIALPAAAGRLWVLGCKVSTSSLALWWGKRRGAGFVVSVSDLRAHSEDVLAESKMEEKAALDGRVATVNSRNVARFDVGAPSKGPRGKLGHRPALRGQAGRTPGFGEPAAAMEAFLQMLRVVFFDANAHAAGDAKLLARMAELLKPVVGWAKVQETRKARELAEKKYRDVVAEKRSLKKPKPRGGVKPETLQKALEELDIL